MQTLRTGNALSCGIPLIIIARRKEAHKEVPHMTGQESARRVSFMCLCPEMHAHRPDRHRVCYTYNALLDDTAKMDITHR